MSFLQLNKIPWNELELTTKPSMRGGHASIAHAIWRKGNSRGKREVAVAVKQFFFNGSIEIDMVDAICRVNRKNHPNLVRYYGISEDRTSGSLRTHLVMEFIDSGSLFDLIHQPTNSIPLDSKMILRIITGIAGGLHFLHTLPSPLIHQDLKSPNVLLQVKDNTIIPKITDFGISKRPKNLIDTVPNEGSYPWMCPQALNGDNITTQSDLYSLGVVIWEIIYRPRIPWDGAPRHDVQRRLLQGQSLPLDKKMEVTDPWIAVLHNLMRKLFALNPSDRPTAPKLIELIDAFLLQDKSSSVDLLQGLLDKISAQDRKPGTSSKKEESDDDGWGDESKTYEKRQEVLAQHQLRNREKEKENEETEKKVTHIFVACEPSTSQETNNQEAVITYLSNTQKKAILARRKYIEDTPEPMEETEKRERQPSFPPPTSPTAAIGSESGILPSPDALMPPPDLTHSSLVSMEHQQVAEEVEVDQQVLPKISVGRNVFPDLKRPISLSKTLFRSGIVFNPNKLVFFPPRTPESTKNSIITKYHNISLLQVSVPNPKWFTIICHDEVSDLGSFLANLSELEEYGKAIQSNILLFEYPGFEPHSRESPNTEGADGAALVAYHYVTSKLSWSPARVVVHGQSVGCGPALAIATNYACIDNINKTFLGTLILQNCFVSFKEIVRLYGPKRSKFVLRERWINSEAITQVSGPTLFLHGMQALCPLAGAKAIYALCPSENKLAAVFELGGDYLPLGAITTLTQKFFEQLDP